MKILFISDLHLGSPLFKVSANKLKSLFLKYDKIIIIGDLIDGWYINLNKTLKKKYTHVNIINANADKIIIILGNHDPDIKTMGILFPHIDIHKEIYEEEEFVCIHGHQFDKTQKFAWIAKIFFPIHVFLASNYNFNFKYYLKMLYKKFIDKYYSYDNYVYKTICKEFVKKFGDFKKPLISGHTHVPYELKKKDFIYYNSGDLIRNLTCVEYDSKTKIFKLKNI